MSDDCLPTHVKEMRDYIAYVSSTDSEKIRKESVVDTVSPTLTQARLVVDSLENIGLEKLSLLFEDRSYAEIIFENCVLFKRRFADGDFETTEIIAEAFTKIFEKVKKDRFELIGLSEGQINVLTGNVQILSENYSPIIKEKDDSTFIDCLDKINELITTWESHREVEDTASADFNEGVETGMMRAANDLKTLIDQYKNKVQTEQVEMNNSKLTEEKGDI